MGHIYITLCLSSFFTKYIKNVRCLLSEKTKIYLGRVNFLCQIRNNFKYNLKLFKNPRFSKYETELPFRQRPSGLENMPFLKNL